MNTIDRDTLIDQIQDCCADWRDAIFYGDHIERYRDKMRVLLKEAETLGVSCKLMYETIHLPHVEVDSND